MTQSLFWLTKGMYILLTSWFLVGTVNLYNDMRVRERREREGGREKEINKKEGERETKRGREGGREKEIKREREGEGEREKSRVHSWMYVGEFQ